MSISNQLKEKGFTLGAKVCAAFDEIYPDILEKPIVKPSLFMEACWNKYNDSCLVTNTQSLNGKIFEALIATILYRSGIFPFYVQAKLAYVPNVDFDFVLYSKEYGPIVLSAKTSLRERYKQADLEGMMLRQVHRNAKTFLITVNVAEAKSVNQKIEKGQVLGIDAVVVATCDAFNKKISWLQTLNYYQPPDVKVIEGKIIQ